MVDDGIVAAPPLIAATSTSTFDASFHLPLQSRPTVRRVRAVDSDFSRLVAASKPFSSASQLSGRQVAVSSDRKAVKGKLNAPVRSRMSGRARVTGV